MPNQFPTHKATLGRIPRRFNEGPFWGNGSVGSILHIEDGHLRFTFDHVRLWEERDPYNNHLIADYQELLRGREQYERLCYRSFPADAGRLETCPESRILAASDAGRVDICLEAGQSVKLMRVSRGSATELIQSGSAVASPSR